MPLVDEANAVIAARAQDLIAARARAGDLAHALKTPLALINVQLRRLRAEGQSSLADPIAEEVDNMDRVIRRELARARANIHAASLQHRTAAFPIVERTCLAISRLNSGGTKTVTVDFDRSIELLIDETDLMEMVGNLTENAMKWARSSIQVFGARQVSGGASLTVDDDGPGLSPADILTVQTRGMRLDQSVQGTGLGLGIVRDLCELYGGELLLGRAPSGGLRATITFPSSRVA
jgi:signal transduction histidine kinase